MNIIIAVFSAAFCLFISQCSATILSCPVDYVLKIVPLVHAHYGTALVTITYLEPDQGLRLQDSSILFNIAKNLSGSGIAVLIHTIFDLSEGDAYKEKSTLLVILSSSNVTKLVLEEMSYRHFQLPISWLLFLAEDQTEEEFLEKVYIPFNSQFLVVTVRDDGVALTEVYKMSKDAPLQKSVMMQLSALSGRKLSLYERRNDLRGHVITSTAVNEPPVLIYATKSDGTLTTSGYFGKVWNILEKRINFLTYFKVPTDMAWGTLENGSWNGMVNMVHSNQVDIAISEFTMTKNRLDVVDYTMPLLFKRIFVRASNDAKYSEWGNFVAPFSPSLWLILGVFIVGISAFFHVLHAIRMHMCDSKKRVPRRYCPYKSVFHVLGAFCQQGQGITPRSSSCRIALLFTLLTAVLTLSTYSASFISNLSIPITKFPYDNLEQMLNQGNYTFAVLRQSAEYDQFETSKVRFLKDVYRIHLAPHKDDLPTTDLSAIQRLCKRDKYSVLVSMDLAEGLMDQVGCTIVPLAKEIFPATLTMIATKSSPYLGVINYYLIKLRDSGILQRLRTISWPPKIQQTDNNWTSVNVYKVVSIVLLLATGATFACVILGVELLMHCSVVTKSHVSGSIQDQTVIPLFVN